MHKIPYFTIIIPALNEAKLLPHLLQDLTSQSYQDFEVIIVDGHSQDATALKAKSFASRLPSLKVIVSEKRNVSFQRNLGAKSASANWLIFMDADNRLKPYFLQGIKYKIEYLRPSILTTYILPDSTNSRDQILIRLINAYMDLQKNSTHPICLESFLAFRKNVFQKLNGFKDTIPWGEGNDLLQRAHKLGINLTFTKDPPYQYSLRRLRTEGTLKLARNIAENELYRVFGSQLPPQKARKFYPMKGGTYFDKPKNKRTSLEKIIDELIKPRSIESELSKIRHKLKLSDWLKT